MEINKLRCFLHVYKKRSIQKASQELYISQQAVSKTIQKFEKETGLVLFVRTSSGMVPTEAACRLAKMIETVLADMDRLEEEVLSLRSEPEGKVRIGILPGHLGASDYLPIRIRTHCWIQL